MISSIQNPHIKLVRDLISHPKERQASSRFVAEGVRLIEEIFEASWQLDFLLYSEKVNDRGKAIVDRASRLGVEVLEVHPDLLNRISDTDQSQGILAVVETRIVPEPAQVTLVLIMDAIRDPGNLGTILRTAAAAGVQTVWMTPDCAEPFSPKALRAGMGSQFRLPIAIKDWPSMAHDLQVQGLQPYLSEMDGGASLWEVNLTKPVALVVSNEANGATSLAKEFVHHSIQIPMPGQAESLNVSIAAGILLYEAVRQRERK